MTFDAWWKTRGGTEHHPAYRIAGAAYEAALRQALNIAEEVKQQSSGMEVEDIERHYAAGIIEDRIRALTA